MYSSSSRGRRDSGGEGDSLLVDVTSDRGAGVGLFGSINGGEGSSAPPPVSRIHPTSSSHAVEDEYAAGDVGGMRGVVETADDLLVPGQLGPDGKVTSTQLSTEQPLSPSPPNSHDHHLHQTTTVTITLSTLH